MVQKDVTNILTKIQKRETKGKNDERKKQNELLLCRLLQE